MEQKRDTEFRIEQLRQARGLSNPTTTSSSTSSQVEEIVQSAVHVQSVVPETKTDSKHINLFEGIRIFDPITEVKKEGGKEMNKKLKKKEESPSVVTADDEKYRLGYGVAGKGVKLPWYMPKLKSDDDAGDEKEKDSDDEDQYHQSKKNKGNDNGNKRKKSLEELREEMLKRETIEKEREAALLRNKSRRVGGGGGGFSWQR